MRHFGRRYRIKLKLLLTLAILLALSLMVFIFIDRNINPAIIAMSQGRIQALTLNSMNTAIKNVLFKDIKYTDLVNILTDKNGKISMIQANTVKMNELASDAAAEASKNIGALKEIEIPLGTITGSKLLQGWGPNIKVKIKQYGSVYTDFASEFEYSGINQTRHKIYLTMKARVNIVIPLGSEVIDVSTRVPVTETIIVGDVPNSYVNVDETDKMLNLIPDGD